MKRVYISGKMSGLPNHGYPAFFAAAEKLRGMGFYCISPAEMNGTKEMSWSEYLIRDLSLLFHCDAIALLPNWRDSPGAQLELAVAIKLGLRVLDAETGEENFDWKCDLQFLQLPKAP